jgi:hypothetical protein
LSLDPFFKGIVNLPENLLEKFYKKEAREKSAKRQEGK